MRKLHCRKLLLASGTFLLFTFHGLGPLASSVSELTSEAMNPFRHFGRTHWTGDRPNARPLPTQDSRAQKNACTGNQTHDPSVQVVQGHVRLRHRGHWYQL
jgi:hypothetical protein